MPLAVEHWDVGTDGKLTASSMRRKLESRGYSVTRYIYPPGTYFPDHAHEVDKIDALVTGQFMMRMAGESVITEGG